MPLAARTQSCCCECIVTVINCSSIVLTCKVWPPTPRVIPPKEWTYLVDKSLLVNTPHLFVHCSWPVDPSKSNIPLLSQQNGISAVTITILAIRVVTVLLKPLPTTVYHIGLFP